MDYPRKPIELRITVSGHNWEEVLRALDERVSRIHEHRELGAGCCASGYGASHTADVMLRDVSREQFANESIAWLEAQHAKRRELQALADAHPPGEPLSYDSATEQERAEIIDATTGQRSKGAT